jgi:hypothetical protein
MLLEAIAEPGEWESQPAGRALTLRATAARPVSIGRCAITLDVRCPEPPYIIDQYLCWRELRGVAVSSEWTPLLLRWRAADGRVMELRGAKGTPAVRLAWRRGKLGIQIELDVAALHPRWSFAEGVGAVSTASPTRAVSWRVAVPLLLLERTSLSATPAVSGRFPGGAEAALTITDHCDFDAVESFRVFLGNERGGRGWLGRGLRFTKGVFTIESRSGPRAPAPTLQDREYRGLVERLRDDGSEIAPHGVNERGNVEPARFLAALDEIATDFSPRTWIDHGSTLHYCYSMGGAENPDYRLLHELRGRGIDCLWSYHDAPASAIGSLNLLAPSSSDLTKLAWQMGKHVLRGNHLVAARYGRSALLERTTGSVQRRLGRALSAARRRYVEGTENGQSALRAAAGIPWAVLTQPPPRGAPKSAADSDHRMPFSRNDVLDLAPTIYPERAVSLSQMEPDDTLLFATLEVLHTEDAYIREAIERLIDERGLHIAHSYLLNRLPYIAGIFSSPGAESLSSSWIEALQNIEEAVASRRLWNPPVGELAEWARAAQQVEVRIASDHALVLNNVSDECVADYTVLLPEKVSSRDVRWDGCPPSGSRQWGSWLSVWGRLPAGRETLVQWG